MKNRQIHFKYTKTAITLLFISITLVFSGCCLENQNKPGVILRGDLAIELNRTKAIQKTSETITCDDDAKPRRSRKHRFPCGRFGCLKCALAPSTGEVEEDDFDEEDSDNSNQYIAQNPNAAYPPGPYPVPYFAGPIGPLGAPIPMNPPVPVINPNTGQRLVMQPVLPGQPGMLMLNAMTGQPILVSPIPPHPITPGMVPPGIQAQPPGMVAGPMPQSGPMNQMTGQPGFMPGAGISPNMPPILPGNNVAVMMNPATGQPMPNPYDGSDGNGNGAAVYTNPLGMYAQTEQNSDAENESDSSESDRKSSKKSPMPLPKFHGVPTKPVYQRTNGIVTQTQKEEEERLRKIQLERVLGTKVPEGTNISPNGVNQQLIQTSSGSDLGGGSANSSPFYSISNLLGPQAQQQTVNVDKEVQQEQLLFQKQQLKEMQKKLDKMEQDKQAEIQRQRQEAELRVKLQAKESKKQSLIGNTVSIIPGPLASLLSPNEQSTKSRSKLPPVGKQLAQNPPIPQERKILTVSQNTPVLSNEPLEIEVMSEEDESNFVAQNDENVEYEEYEQPSIQSQPVVARHHNHVAPQPQRRIVSAPQPTMNYKPFPYSKDSGPTKSGVLFDIIASKLKDKPRIDPRQQYLAEQRLAAQRASVQRSLGMTPIAEAEPSPIKQVSSMYPAPVPETISTEDE